MHLIGFVLLEVKFNQSFNIILVYFIIFSLVVATMDRTRDLFLGLYQGHAPLFTTRPTHRPTHDGFILFSFDSDIDLMGV